MGMGRGWLTAFIAFALAFLSLPLGAMPAAATSPDLVISQIYGGGGNSGAQFKNDFVELFNRGTSAVSLNGKSVQYATTTGALGANGLMTLLPNVMLGVGQYFLVQEAAGAGTTLPPLPAPDAIGAINMSAMGAKVALVNSTAALGCSSSATCAAVASLIIDLIGYDGATFFEGTAAPTLSNTTAALRGNGGCVDTDNNAADFAASAPAPRNSASPTHFCVGDVAPAVASTTPTNGASGVGVSSNITITFTEPVDAAVGWYDITCASGPRTASVTGGPTTFTLDPSTDFATDESCTATIFAAKLTDQDLIDPPDN